MILYHGSNVEASAVDLLKCKSHKDFGQGFYLTTSEQQAFSMAHRTTAIFGHGKPVVSVFELDDGWQEAGLSVRVFDSPSPNGRSSS